MVWATKESLPCGFHSLWLLLLLDCDLRGHHRGLLLGKELH